MLRLSLSFSLSIDLSIYLSQLLHNFQFLSIGSYLSIYCIDTSNDKTGKMVHEERVAQSAKAEE